MLFFNTFLSANDYWKFKDIFTLEKNKFYAGTFRYRRDKNFSFRWTLYKNKILVIHMHYDNFFKQFILEKEDYQKNSFKLPLFSASNRNFESPYLLLTFLKFDKKKQKPIFEIKIRDVEDIIEVINKGK